MVIDLCEEKGLEDLVDLSSINEILWINWEKTKATRAEKDIAIHGALRMMETDDDRQAIFVYGDGRQYKG